MSSLSVWCCLCCLLKSLTVQGSYSSRSIPYHVLALNTEKNDVSALSYRWFQGFDWDGLRQRTLVGPIVQQVSITHSYAIVEVGSYWLHTAGTQD
jgi:hypothetical protein